MHPSLSTSALRRLPVSLRKSAYAAVSGTPADFRKMVREATEVLPRSKWGLFLPVFYAHLDPTKARQLQQQDSDVLGSADADFVVSAFLAVQGLSVIHKIPEEVCPDLWPGVWQWSHLVTKHHYCLPAHDIKQSREGPILCFVVIRRIYKACDAACAKTIASEPGIRATVARAWALLSRKSGWTPTLRTDGFDAAVHMLRFAMDLENRQHHDDLVEGCGGSLRDLAAVMVNFVTRLMTEDMNQSVHLLASAMAIVHKTEKLRDGFRDLLLEQGMVRALVIALRKISTHIQVTHEKTLENGVLMLVSLIFHPRCHLWFIQCLRAGVLRLIGSALENPHLIALDHLEGSILDCFTLFLPYRSVLIEFRSALADMHVHMDQTLARRSQAWDARILDTVY